MMAEYRKAAAVAFEYTDWQGRPVSYQAYMSAPKMTPVKKMKDGTYILGKVEFTIDQL
jgi:hypothetical protein